jgi:photosystem II stability/assembly factor-like uncharacterized protein
MSPFRVTAGSFRDSARRFPPLLQLGVVLALLIAALGLPATSSQAAPGDWTVLANVTTQHLYGLSCASSSLCVMVGDSGTILTSSDSGVTWTPRTSGTALAAPRCPCVG